MRFALSSLLALFVLAAPDAPRDACAMGAAPLAAREGGEAATAVHVAAKFKCGIDENGKFRCRKVEHNKDKGKVANKCKGPNNCGPGYRDLEVPSKYGACCEQVAAPSKTDDGPKSGGCQKAEPNKHTLNCTPPFPARSCGALGADGKMTCCCVK